MYIPVVDGDIFLLNGVFCGFLWGCDMKRILKVVTWLVFIVAGIYLCGVMLFFRVFPFRTYLNNVSIFFDSPAELTIKLMKHTAARDLSFVLPDGSVQRISFEEAGIYKDSDALFSEKGLINGFEWPKSLFSRKDYTTYPDLFYNEAKLKQSLRGMPFVLFFEPATDAYLSNKNGTYELVYEDDGTEIDFDKFFALVCDGLDANVDTFYLNDMDCYKHSVLVSSAGDLHCDTPDLAALREQSVTISFDKFGTVDVPQELISVLFYEYDGGVFLKTEFLSQYFEELDVTQYDNYSQFAVFNTSMGTQLTLDADYGYAIDADETFYLLCKALCNPEDDVVNVSWKHKGYYADNDSVLGGTYIELDISTQTMWFYKNGRLVVKTPVVTGTPVPDRITPLGIFRIRRICTNYVMTGETWEMPCKYFLQLTSDGVGIHDANWRDDFGGNIYRLDGSHGCINTPPDKMQEIYEAVVKLHDPKIPVIIYES